MKITGSRTTNRNSHWLRPYGCKFRAHLPPSPSVSLTQFHFLVHLKKTAVGTRFVTNTAVNRAVTSSTDVDADFFRCGIQALAPRWGKYLNVSGAYVGVWCVPSATVCHVHFEVRKKFSAAKYLLNCLWNVLVFALSTTLTVKMAVLRDVRSQVHQRDGQIVPWRLNQKSLWHRYIYRSQLTSSPTKPVAMLCSKQVIS